MAMRILLCEMASPHRYRVVFAEVAKGAPWLSGAMRPLTEGMYLPQIHWTPPP
jgi:hypothetical protein